MSKQNRVLSEEALTEKDADGKQEFLVVEISYNKGGPNMFTGGLVPRGYFVSAHIETREPTPGGMMVGFGLFDGTSVKSLLLAAGRFSPKALDEVQAPPEKIAQLKAHVLAKREERQRKVHQAS